MSMNCSELVLRFFKASQYSVTIICSGLLPWFKINVYIFSLISEAAYELILGLGLVEIQF